MREAERPLLPVHVWAHLDAAQRRRLLARPSPCENANFAATVAEIVARVRSKGDVALREFTRRFDHIDVENLAVENAQLQAAIHGLPRVLARALQSSSQRIERFHRACAVNDVEVKTAPGVRCQRISRPIDTVGLYIPAGSAPLPSTALMLGIPARLAACPRVIACTPPARCGKPDPTLLAAAAMAGIHEVFVVGGAQAIAAMAWGTESIPRCDKIFGPGNRWVTAAKQSVAAQGDGPEIDGPAGPSELLLVADGNADADYVAADLLSQAEHGADSQVLLIADNAKLLEAVEARLVRQLEALPRAATAREALRESGAILVKNLAEAIRISNAYAPEHLIINSTEPRRWLAQVKSAGSIFLGPWAPESVGDFTSGTNHVLPTGGRARATGGVTVDSFRKHISVQELEPAGLAAIGPDAVVIARAEQLEAHAQAIDLRLRAMGGAA